MRKIYLSVFSALIGITSWSQCETSVYASDTTLCPGDTAVLTASGPPTDLTTTFAAGNNHRGNMFDITAINSVTIQSFDAHPMGDTDYEIYYKVGSYSGSEANAAAWTLVGSATGVLSQGTGVPTPIPINVGVTIPAGQTYAFYVTSTNTAVSLNYSNGTTEGAVYASDANIQFLEGVGMEYPFTAGGSIFSPRIWNGVIHYSTGVTTYSWSTGATTATQSVAPATQTTYYVDITPNGCSTVTDSVTIYINPVPTVDLGADTTVCPGTQVTLDAGVGAATYDWNNGFSSNQTVTVLPGTDYFVAVTNVEGCYGYDTISVIQQTPPLVDLGGNTAVCEGTTTTLDAGNVGATYAWDTGASTQTIDVGPGSYSVTVTDNAGCTGSDNVTISSNPLPVVDLGQDTTICINETGSLDAGSGFAAYLWSTTESTQTITVDGATLGAGPHSYTVQVTDSNGCQNLDTIIVTVDPCGVGLDELQSNSIIAYPNPTNNLLQVELNGWNGAAIVRIYNADGKMVAESNMTGTSQTFDFSGYSSGTYLIEIRSDEQLGRVRVVKN